MLQGVWESLAEVLRVALMPPDDIPRVTPAAASASAAADAQTEERLLDCLCNTVVASCGLARLAAKRRLLSILEDACAAPERTELGAEHRLCHTSLRKLHEICGRAVPQQHGALSAGPSLREVLLMFEHGHKAVRVDSSTMTAVQG